VTQRSTSALLVSALAFTMMAGYSIARPASESLFLAAHGAKQLPLAWIAVAITVVATVTIYNRAAARYPLSTVLLGSYGATIATLMVLLALERAAFPGASFALYVWKDVHVVVLIEILWSFANVLFKTESARWMYGLFCAAGSVGSLVGNLSVGWLALRFGSAASLLFVLPLFGTQAVIGRILGRQIELPKSSAKAAGSFAEGVAMLRRSRYLVALLLLVGTVQLVVNLVDFQFNVALQRAYPDTDARTALIGQVYAVIDGSSLMLQLATGLVIKAVGVRRTLLVIPVLLGAALVGTLLTPVFLVMATLKVASKALDYSLFRAAKELLYIPLSYDEKTRGKAFIDMMTYRVSKGGASLLVAALVGVGATVGLATLGLLVVWSALTVRVTRRYEALRSGDAGSP